jgi:hypothetical protein
MVKLWERGSDLMVRRLPRAEERTHRDGPEHDDHLGLWEEHELALEEGLTTGELGSRRLVLRRRAPHRRGDVTIP